MTQDHAKQSVITHFSPRRVILFGRIKFMIKHPTACDSHIQSTRAVCFCYLKAGSPALITPPLSWFRSLKAGAWPPVLLSPKRSIHFHNYDTRWPFLAPLPTAGVTPQAFFPPQHKAPDFKWTHTSWSPPPPPSGCALGMLLDFDHLSHLQFIILLSWHHKKKKAAPLPPQLLCHYNDTDTSSIVCVWQWMESNTIAGCLQSQVKFSPTQESYRY